MPRKSNAKERILTTAGQLFGERGYSEVGINEIIDKAGTAKATFYQHFPSKDELCEAWLDSVHERSECSRAKILEAPGDATEKIYQYFEDLGKYIEHSKFRGCPYSNTGAVVGSECVGIRQQIEDHKISIRDFFKALAVEFTANETRAREIGDTLFILYSGSTSEAQNLKEMWPIEAAKIAVRELCENEKLR